MRGFNNRTRLMCVHTQTHTVLVITVTSYGICFSWSQESNSFLLQVKRRWTVSHSVKGKCTTKVKMWALMKVVSIASYNLTNYSTRFNSLYNSDHIVDLKTFLNFSKTQNKVCSAHWLTTQSPSCSATCVRSYTDKQVPSFLQPY